MEVNQRVVGNTGNMSVSKSSSPAGASVSNQVMSRSVGQPGMAGGTGNSNLNTPGGVQNQAQGNPVIAPQINTAIGPGQPDLSRPGLANPNYSPPRPDMNQINGLTDQLRSGVLDVGQFTTQIKDYLANYRNQLRTDLSGAVNARRQQAQAQVAAAQQAGMQRASGALANARTTATAAGASPAQLQGISSAEQWLIDRESGGDVNAYNPQSTDTGNAFGIGQLTTANRNRYGQQLGINPDTTNPDEQLALMRAYITDRYGSAENAMKFWQQNGYY